MTTIKTPAEPRYLSLGKDARKLMACKLEEMAGLSVFDCSGYIDEPLRFAKIGSLESLKYVCGWLKACGVVSADQLEEMAKQCEKQAQVRA